MDSVSTTVANLFAVPAQYEIRPLQRYYVWDERQWHQLWQDIIETTEERRPAHFLGTIMLTKQVNNQGMIASRAVTDGQQRMITLSLLLAALRDCAFESPGAERIAHEIENFLVHPHRTGMNKYKIYPKVRQKEEYFAIIKRQSFDQRCRFAKAYLYFRKMIGTSDMFRSAEHLDRLMVTIATRLELNVMTIEEARAYQIFQSMNSTGTHMNQADLIRSHVFSCVSDEDQTAFDSEPWTEFEARFMKPEPTRGRKSKVVVEAAEEFDADTADDFFRDFMMMSIGMVPEHMVYESFSKIYPREKMAGPRTENLVRYLTHLANLHRVLRGVDRDPRPSVQAALERLRQQSSSTAAAPLLLKLMEMVNPFEGQPTLNEGRLVDVIEQLTSFLFRRIVCGESTKNYVKWFANACKVLTTKKNDLGFDPVSEIRQYLIDKHWPEDLKFKSAFVSYKLYKKQKQEAKLILAEIAGAKPADLKDLEVEHVMPQTLDDVNWKDCMGVQTTAIHDSLCDTPGNLALLSRSQNAILKNSSYLHKKPMLAAYKFQATEIFHDVSSVTWGFQDIQKRSRAMAEIAAKVWPGPSGNSSIENLLSAA